MSLRLSLRTKITAIVVFILVLVFAAITVVRVQQNRTALRAQLISTTNTFAAVAANDIAAIYTNRSSAANASRRLNQIVTLDNDVVGAALFKAGQGVQRYGRTDAVASQLSGDHYTFNGRGNLETVRMTDTGSGTTVVLQVSDARLQAAIAKQIRSIVILSAIGTVVSAAVVILALNRSVIRPIRLLTRQAKRIQGGDYDSPLNLKRGDEIGQLAAGMDAMEASLKASTEQLAALDDAKSEFMMIASHTLRTPITVIKGSLEIIKSEPIGDASQRMLKIAEVATQRLSSFAEDLLVVSNLEVGQQSIRLEPLVIDDTTFEAIVSYGGTLAQQKGIDFVTEIEPNLSATVLANRPYIGNAVWNLIDNAIKFTNKGQVRFALKQAGGQLVISVDDSGIGIIDPEIDKVFDKLHRGTSTEQYDYEGGGIGLYVTKKIVESHHGSVDVHSLVGHGSTFTISLPLAT